ncbi:MAG: HD domain-containing protein, partial [Candidatus Omnitrophica bacterium]|nr:HD domain-containing protein [Candidatus Omnitrophota bacterium]
LLEDNSGLLKLAMDAVRSGADRLYLYEHAVNTCILSLVIGSARGYEKEELMDLGLAAFLHDLGMIKYYHLAVQPRRLTGEERDIIQNHSRIGADILERAGKGLPEVVSQVAHQHHERNDGSGYPRGLNRGIISQYAAIIGIADAYEAMTHRRPYREEYTPFEAVQSILANKNYFEYKLIKILIEKIGIFPIGTFVELNNHSIGRVLKINHQVPLRPVVEVIVDGSGKRLDRPLVLDLANDPNKHIKRAVKLSEIK